MKWKKLLAVFLFLAMTISLVSAGHSSFNGSEPDFLKDIGPQEDRSDNPWAALVVVIGVASVLYIGFTNSDSINAKDDDAMDS